MKYENGNIILSSKEKQLLNVLSDVCLDEPIEVQHFVCAMHSLKQDLKYLLEDFQEDPDFAKHEREIRSNMDVMTQAFDQLRARAVALARAAGEELAFE